MTDSLALQTALQLTEKIESPAIGFAKPSSVTGLPSLLAIVVKQNNTQLQLLATIADNLAEIKQDLKKLLHQTPTPIPEDLITKLQNLSLGPKERPKEIKGTIRVFKDPYNIAKEEKDRARLHYKF